MQPLPHPPEAEKDAESIEILRGWIVDGELQIGIAPWAWREQPAEWGRLLAESAGHMADAIAQQTGRDRDELYRIITESIAHHLQEPLERSGEFVDEVPPTA